MNEEVRVFQILSTDVVDMKLGANVTKVVFESAQAVIQAISDRDMTEDTDIYAYETQNLGYVLIDESLVYIYPKELAFDTEEITSGSS
jgi:hypothetical protein